MAMQTRWCVSYQFDGTMRICVIFMTREEADIVYAYLQCIGRDPGRPEPISLRHSQNIRLSRTIEMEEDIQRVMYGAFVPQNKKLSAIKAMTATKDEIKEWLEG